MSACYSAGGIVRRQIKIIFNYIFVDFWFDYDIKYLETTEWIDVNTNESKKIWF